MKHPHVQNWTNALRDHSTRTPAAIATNGSWEKSCETKKKKNNRHEKAHVASHDRQVAFRHRLGGEPLTRSSIVANADELLPF